MKTLVALTFIAALTATVSATELNVDRPEFCIIGETCEVVDVPAPKSWTTGVLGLLFIGAGLYFRRKS